MAGYKLSNDQWRTIFTNLSEDGEEVEVLWLDSTDEWILCLDDEVFEDGFISEQEAIDRLSQLQRELDTH